MSAVLLAGLPILGLLWVLSVPQMLGMRLVTQQVVTVLLGMGVAASLLHHPYFSRHVWIDILIAMLGLACWTLYAINFEKWMLTLAFRTPDMWVPGAIALVLLIEALRKSMGLALALLIWAVIAYGLWGDAIPGTLQAEVFAPTRTILYLYADSNGVPGLVLRVVVNLVLPFLIFGKLMELSGGMVFFNNLAQALVGHRRGGPAKVAIVASGFFGTLSGSTVANIMSTGVFTIPLMIKTGFRRTQAAAIESVASNGGQIAPPIMGATAFVMSEFLQIPYSEIALAAAIPAFLYFAVLFMKVDGLAIKRGLKGAPKSELPGVVETLKSGWVVILPIATLMYLLFSTGYNPGLSAVISSGVMFAMHVIAVRFRVDWRAFARALLDLGREFFPILLIGGGAGIIIGLMNTTGFAFQISLALTQVGQTYGLFALLLLAAIVSIVLGMGMPTTAVYIVLVSVVAPAVVDFGVLPLGAHLFLLYFGLMSMVTPPIAVGSMVAARLAGANMWSTGFLGMRLGVTAYFLPFLWVFNPAVLLRGSLFEIMLVVSNVLAAAYLFKISLLKSPFHWMPERLYAVIAFASGILVFAATAIFGSASLAAVVCSVVVAGIALTRTRNAKTDAPEEADVINT